ncbi:MAG: aminoacyl-tRNA hydrolase [Candidatus Krumholzibacteria bacterium]|nr:aminoacyl-tRNA hydrolase [Candidatus Krumholzibacteria bacterium]
MSEISILCGLGNPGADYRGTRHNLGSETIDLLSERHNLHWEKTAGPVLESRWGFSGGEVFLLKPLTFMNASGDALAGYRDLDPGSLLVICDDINLPLGRLRLRERGSSGGHLGLESIISRLGSEGFARLRLGIGSPPSAVEWSEYVLSPFLGEEMERVERMCRAAADALETVLREGLETAMHLFNRRPFPPTTP